MRATGSERRRRRQPSAATWRSGRIGRPPRTLRLRLTLLYGGLFLITGFVLLAITYELVAHSSETSANKQLVLKQDTAAPAALTALAKGRAAYLSIRGVGKTQIVGPPPTMPPAMKQLASKLQGEARAAIVRQRHAQLDALLTRSGVALEIMAIVSIGLGWLMAGRALRPMRAMSARARTISERNLHERLAVDGPDELKELGDTFDGLLARLETAFESQRRFVANASHELRTPITVERTLVEVALADPEATIDGLRGTCERVLAACEEQERLIEALLTLARSQRGLDARSPVDVGEVVAAVLQGRSAAPVRVELELEDAVCLGDPALLERLVANLVENAIAYNVDSGWIRVSTGQLDGRTVLRITNTGPVIEDGEARALVEPFRRLDGRRSGRRRGLGLGLSIVEAIAAAHGAELRTVPRPGGGLDVRVLFPARAAPVLASAA